MTEYTVCCQYCDVSMEEQMLQLHEKYCIANPENLRCDECNFKKENCICNGLMG